MNHGIVLFLFISVFFKYYPNIEKATKETEGKGSTSVVFAQARVDRTFEAANHSLETFAKSTPFKRLGFPTPAGQRNGDGQGAMEMLLVQATEQADGDAMWGVLHPVEQMYRHPLQAWTKEPTIGAGAFSFEEKAAEGEMDRLGLFATKAITTTRLRRAFTTKKTKDTEEEEADRAKLWSTHIGPAMATCRHRFKSSANDSSCHGEGRDVIADRIGARHRDFRQAHPRGSADSDREGEETHRTTTYYGQDSQASFRQVGEEEKGTPAGTQCKIETPYFLDTVCRRINQEMEKLRHRFCHKRCRIGEEGQRSSRSSTRSEVEIRHSKGRQRSTRSRDCGRARRDLGWHGRGQPRENGDFGGNPGQHHNDGDEPGEPAYAPASRSRTASSQEAANRCRRRWGSSWIWIICSQAFSSARQIDQRKEVCLGLCDGSFQQENYVVRQWTHSILEGQYTGPRLGF